MQDILNLIKERRSIRKYKKEKIDRESIIKILEAGRFSPSAENNQPWRFFVLTKEDSIKSIGKACKYAFLNAFVKEAPLVIVIYSEKTHHFVKTDCGLCAQNMMLEAHALGIGSCYIGAFREKSIKKILGLSEKEKILGIITFGYPEKIPSAPERLPLEEIVKSDSDIFPSNYKSLNIRNIFKSDFLSLVARFFKDFKKRK